MAKLSVVFNADDLGLTYGFNAGIRHAAEHGLLSSTSLRVNGPAYEQAVREFIPDHPHVGIGLHLNIVEGGTLRPGVKHSHLCDGDGAFHHGFPGLLKARRDPDFLEEVEEEFRDQIERAMRDVSSFDHLNTHQHSHGIPELFEIVCRLAREYGVPYVRLQQEPLYFSPPLHRHLRTWYPANIAKWAILNRFAEKNRRTAQSIGVRTNDRFLGILYTGFMNRQTIIDGLRKCKDGETVEILLHPSIPSGDRKEVYLDRALRDYDMSFERLEEARTLTSVPLAEALEGRTQVTSYSRLAGLSDIPSKPAAVSKDITPEFATPSSLPLRTMVIIDETPFYHPQFLDRLICDCRDLEIVDVAAVSFRDGLPLQKYLLRNFRQLKLREFLHLGFSSLARRLFGKFPRFLRGDFESSVAAVCRRHGIPCSTVDSVNDDEFLAKADALHLDLILSSNSLIFKERLLNLPRYGCINRHSALLPAYGGILPVFRARQMDELHTGVSVHTMVHKIDRGEILSRKWIPIFDEDSLSDLYKLCFMMSVEAVREAAVKITRQPRPDPLPDEGLVPSYYSFPAPKDWQEFRRRGGRFV